MDRLQADILAWANGISPGRSPQDAVVKLVSEASELLDAVLNGKDVEGELGDCIILLLDLAAMHNINLAHAGHKKMGINRNRVWEAENGVIRRKRGNGRVPNTGDHVVMDGRSDDDAS